MELPEAESSQQLLCFTAATAAVHPINYQPNVVGRFVAEIECRHQLVDGRRILLHVDSEGLKRGRVADWDTETEAGCSRVVWVARLGCKSPF